MSEKKKSELGHLQVATERLSKVWHRQGRKLFYSSRAMQETALSNKLFTLDESMVGIFLTEAADRFEFSYKLYGVERPLIDRIKRTYANSKDNLGVLFNGMKGTGKTVTAKVLCNELHLPVLIIDNDMDDLVQFLSSIQQDIVVFIDEYEKIFKDKSSKLLTIMDGVHSNGYRRIFILTTNDLNVSPNILQRPSRIRYLKTFSDMAPAVIEEVVDDMLENKAYRDDIIDFVSSLEIITMDIVKAVIQEVNIHDEPPAAFAGVFNVRRETGRTNYYAIGNNGEQRELFMYASGDASKFDDDSIGSPRSIKYENSYHSYTVLDVKDERRALVRLSMSQMDKYLVNQIYGMLNGLSNVKWIFPKRKKVKKEVEDVFIFYSGQEAPQQNAKQNPTTNRRVPPEYVEFLMYAEPAKVRNASYKYGNFDDF